MNILSRILSGPAIKQLRQRVADGIATRDKLAQFAARGAAAETAAADARDKFFETVEPKDFDAWVVAQNKLAAVMACAAEANRRAGYMASAELETPAARELLIDALRDSADTLDREIDALASDEKQRLAASGIEAASENPALSKLRARVVELRGCYSDLTARESVGAYLNRYLTALGIV